MGGASAVAMGLALAWPLDVALEPLADRNRDPPRRDHRPARLHRPWHGRRDRRDSLKSATIARSTTGLPWAGRHWNQGKRHPTLGQGGRRRGGAKILGPILVGDGAKVGSNAVVVARRSGRSDSGWNPGADRDRRTRPCAASTQAAKIGFSAYAISADMNDPMVQAVHSLLDHATATDERLQKLIDLLQAGGIECGDAKATADRFDPEQLNRMLD